MTEGWAVELSHLLKVAVEREQEMWKVAHEVIEVLVQKDTVKAELEFVPVELVSARQAVDYEEPEVGQFGAPGSLKRDILMFR